MNLSGGPENSAVVRGDFNQVFSRIHANIDGFAVIINVIALRVNLAFVSCRLQEAVVGEDHVIVEPVQGGLFAFAAAAPPVCRLFGKEFVPGGGPEAVAEVFPLIRDQCPFQYRLFVRPGLDSDTLIEEQIAGAIEAAAEDDGVTSAGGGDGFLQPHR